MLLGRALPLCAGGLMKIPKKRHRRTFYSIGSRKVEALLAYPQCLLPSWPKDEFEIQRETSRKQKATRSSPPLGLIVPVESRQVYNHGPHPEAALEEEVPPEAPVVPVPHAGPHPEAVVVKPQHAAVALVAVLRPQRLPQLAVRAPLPTANKLAA
jgi:hypothetical protein